jgi:hypothetical protein
MTRKAAGVRGVPMAGTGKAGEVGAVMVGAKTKKKKTGQR